MKEEERRGRLNSFTAENLTLRNDEVFIPLDTSSFVVNKEEEFEGSEGGRETPAGVFGAYYRNVAGADGADGPSFEQAYASKRENSALDFSNRTPSVNINDESAMNMCTEFSKQHRRNETESELNCTTLGRGKESVVEGEEEEEKRKGTASARRITDSYSPVILNNLCVNVRIAMLDNLCQFCVNSVELAFLRNGLRKKANWQTCFSQTTTLFRCHRSAGLSLDLTPSVQEAAQQGKAT